MPIAVTANSLQHWPSPSKRRPASHTICDGRASSSHQANGRRTCYRFFNFWPWEAYPLSKGHQKRRRPTTHLDLPSCKISAQSRKRSTRYALPIFSLFGLWGANSWAKVHQKGRRPGGLRDLPPAKFHRSAATHARDIRYQNPADKQTKNKQKQTVNDISPTCQSACGDNNMPIGMRA